MRKSFSLALCVFMLCTLFAGIGIAESPIKVSIMVPLNSNPTVNDESAMWYYLQEGFSAAYPQYSIDFITGGRNSDDYNASVQMAAAANNLSNLTYVSNGYVDDWSNVGLLLDLNDYLDEAFFSQFTPGAVDFTNQYNDTEGTYGLPCRVETQGWVYNVSLFEQCGLEIPVTWTDFMNCVKVFRENGITPIVHGATDIWAIWGYHTMFNNNGLTYDIAMQLQNHELQFKDCAAFVNTFTDIAELSAAGAYNEDVVTTNNNIALSRFAAGQAAMYCTYDTSWYILDEYKATGESDIVDHSVFNFGPAFEDGVGVENFIGNRSYGWSLIPAASIASDKDALEAMLTFLKYFYSSEGTAIIQNYMVPATEFKMADTDSMSMLEASIYASYTADIISAQDLTQAWFDQSIKPTYRNAVTGLICGTLTVEEALKLMQDWADTM